MRRFTGVLALALLLAAALPLAAQSKDPPITVRTVPIMKIYGHALGYRVLYEKSNLEVGEIYLPIEWFNKAGAKGDIVWGSDTSYPYFSIFWKDGRFDHIRLYLRESMRDPSWGRLQDGEGLAQKFRVETLQVEF